MEIVSELEYVPDEGQLADAAIGAKWIPFVSRVSLGIELLAPLPISRKGGAGAEASLLATYRKERVRVHVNAAGFHDARPEAAETGWKGGAIGEVGIGRSAPARSSSQSRWATGSCRRSPAPGS